MNAFVQVLVASNDREVATACTGNEIFPVGALTLLKDMRKVGPSLLDPLTPSALNPKCSCWTPET